MIIFTKEKLHNLRTNWEDYENARDAKVSPTLLIDMVDEIDRTKKAFRILAEMMKHYEVPAEMGKIIMEEAGR